VVPREIRIAVTPEVEGDRTPPCPDMRERIPPMAPRSRIGVKENRRELIAATRLVYRQAALRPVDISRLHFAFPANQP